MGWLAKVLLPLIMAVPAAPCCADVSLQLIPGSVHPGDQVKAKGSGFDSCIPTPSSTSPPTTSRPPIIRMAGRPAPSTGTSDRLAPVTVTVHWVERDGSPGSVLATTSLDASGSFETAFTVPAARQPGSYDVAAECGDPNGDIGEIAYASLTVTKAPTATTSTRPSTSTSDTRPAPSSPVVIPLPPPDITSSDTASPGADTLSSIEPPRPAPQPQPSLLGWLVAIGVVAVLVALATLGRRVWRTSSGPAPASTSILPVAQVSSPPVVWASGLPVTRASSPPMARTSSPPVVQAVLRMSVGGSVELRQTGPGRSVAIRVVPRDDTGIRVVRRVDGVGQE